MNAALPPHWPRARAREVCVSADDGLTQPAEEHVRAIVAPFAQRPHPDIRSSRATIQCRPGPPRARCTHVDWRHDERSSIHGTWASWTEGVRLRGLGDR